MAGKFTVKVLFNKTGSQWVASEDAMQDILSYTDNGEPTIVTQMKSEGKILNESYTLLGPESVEFYREFDSRESYIEYRDDLQIYDAANKALEEGWNIDIIEESILP